MISQNQLDLISSIYDLPLQPENWQSVLDQFAPIMNAAGSGVMAFDPAYAEHHVSALTSNYNPTTMAEYNERFGAEENYGYAKMALDPKRGFVADMEVMGLTSVEKHQQTPAVQWLIENENVRHRAASCLNLQRVWTDIIAVQYHKDRGPISADEKKTGTVFLGHFAKAMELGRSFGVLKSRFGGVLTALDRFHIGIFVLSPNGAVVVKNREADRILDAHDGLSLSREGYLHATNNTESGELKAIIARAISTAQAQDNRAESLMTLARASASDPYLVEVAPIRDHDEIESQFKGCLVFVIDPAKSDVVSTEGMQALYQLTDAESEMSGLLAQGLTTDEMADSRNITRGTARQYIKQILQKAGVNNRAQLVRLALTVNLPIDPARSDD